MKRFIMTVILGLCLYGCCKTGTDPHLDIVYVNPVEYHDPYYHVQSCRGYSSNYSIAIQLDDAEALGFKPCPSCCNK